VNNKEEVGITTKNKFRSTPEVKIKIISILIFFIYTSVSVLFLFYLSNIVYILIGYALLLGVGMIEFRILSAELKIVENTLHCKSVFNTKKIHLGSIIKIKKIKVLGISEDQVIAVREIILLDNENTEIIIPTILFPYAHVLDLIEVIVNNSKNSKIVN